MMKVVMTTVVANKVVLTKVAMMKAVAHRSLKILPSTTGKLKATAS